MSNLRIKWVFRLDTIQRFWRIIRVMWERGAVGDGFGGYSAKLSFALSPRLLDWGKDVPTGWRVTICGLRIHYCRSYGGRFG